MSNNSFEQAEAELQVYIQKDVLNYSRLRNFDFGSKQKNHVSYFSKFISHRIINEYDLLSKLLSIHKPELVEKFVQEIFWRIYWKGWLEKRPAVWIDFIKEINEIKANKGVEIALNSKTNIDCFDHWVFELKQNNYLHNHARMWFASIWIFTLKLPWQLGAKFFMENLMDGDAASNTLSWRWVAGLQTKGKHYLAKPWNIAKFTGNRFGQEKLAEESFPIQEDFDYEIQANPDYNYEKKSDYLILFENDLYINDRKKMFESYKKIWLVILKNSQRKIQLCEKVISFKVKLIDDFSSIFKQAESIEANELQKKINEFNSVDIVYPSVGENLDYVNENLVNTNIKVNFIYRKEDTFCWEFAKKGFFKFKENIPRIMKEFQLG